MAIDNPGFPQEETHVLDAWLKLADNLETLAALAGKVMPPLEATPPDLIGFTNAVKSLSSGLRDFQTNCARLREAVIDAKLSHEATVLGRMN